MDIRLRVRHFELAPAKSGLESVLGFWQLSFAAFLAGHTSLEQILPFTFALNSKRAARVCASPQMYQLHQFGRLVAPKLRYLMLRKVDIDDLLMISEGWPVCPVRCQIVPTPNPYNGGRIVDVVKNNQAAYSLVSK